MKVNYFYLIKAIIESANRSCAPDLSKLSDKQAMKLLKIASSNRVLFILCKAIRRCNYSGMTGRIPCLIDKVVTEGEKIIKQYSELLSKIDKEFKKNDIKFLIVKTDRKVDCIFSDLDILVGEEGFEKAQELLSEMAICKKTSDKEERWHYVFDRKVQIDIHKTGTDWYSQDFIDTPSIWNNTEERQFLGNVYPFPSEQNEWIFNALNIIYERFALTYQDLLFFRKAKNINYTEINKIAKEHYWDNGLRILDKYMKNLECLSQPEENNSRIRLPLMFSFLDFLRILMPRLFRFPNETRVSLYYFLYFIYCKLRFWLSGGYRISFVGTWYEL